MTDEFLADLIGQTADTVVIDVLRQPGVLVGLIAGHFFRLALDVALILGLDFHLFDHQRIADTAPLSDVQRHQPGITHIRAAQQLEQCVFVFNRLAQHACYRFHIHPGRMHPRRAQTLLLKRNGLALLAEGRPALIAHQTELTPNFCQAHVGIVLAQ